MRWLLALALMGCVEDKSEARIEVDGALAPDMAMDAGIEADAAPPEPDAAPPELDAAPVTPCAREDDLAPNQRLSQATPIEAGFDRAGLFACPDVSDYYALTLAAGEIADLDLSADPDNVDLDLVVVDADGVELAGSFGEGGVESVRFEAPTAGAYFVEVSSYRGQTGPYTLAVRRGCRLDDACGDGVCDTLSESCAPYVDGDCGDDDNEPNDRTGDATAIDEGATTGTICVEDRDWFVVDARDGDTFDFTVGFAPGENVDLYLLGPEGRLIDAALGDASQNPARVTLSHAPAGRFLLGVVMPNDDGARRTGYELVVTARSDACEIDRDCLSLGLPSCDNGICRAVPDGGVVGPGERCGRGLDCADPRDFCFQGDPGGHDNTCTRECEGADQCGDFGEGAVCDRSFFGAICTFPCTSDDACSRYNRCDLEGGECRLRGRCQNDGDCGMGEVCTDPFGGGFTVCSLRE